MHVVPGQMEQAGVGMARTEGLSCEPLRQGPRGEGSWKHSQLLPQQSASAREAAFAAQENEYTTLHLPA